MFLQADKSWKETMPKTKALPDPRPQLHSPVSERTAAAHSGTFTGLFAVRLLCVDIKKQNVRESIRSPPSHLRLTSVSLHRNAICTQQFYF